MDPANRPRKTHTSCTSDNVSETELYLQMLYHLERPCGFPGTELNVGKVYVRSARALLPTFKNEDLREILSWDIDNYAKEYGD